MSSAHKTTSKSTLNDCFKEASEIKADCVNCLALMDGFTPAWETFANFLLSWKRGDNPDATCVAAESLVRLESQYFIHGHD